MAVVEPVTSSHSALLHERLEALYRRLNRRDYISPDPMQFLLDYPDPADREIVALVASALAFGNVRQILRSVSSVLEHMPSPAHFLDMAGKGSLEHTFRGFRHRYVADAELVDLLYGIKFVREAYGSLQSAFVAGWGPDDTTVLPALALFTRNLISHGRLPKNYLLPEPERGSACKRLHLFMRWMVRQDEVDLGGWDTIHPRTLLIPLDTHMHRLSRSLGLTNRSAANIRTALEVTGAFRAMVPDDPVRYDFALTRLGIRDDTNAGEFLRECGLTVL